MPKSFDSALIGATSVDGYFYSVNAPIKESFPEIAGRGLDKLRIRDLLFMNLSLCDMEGGEGSFYRAPFADIVPTYYPPDLRRNTPARRPERCRS